MRKYSFVLIFVLLLNICLGGTDLPDKIEAQSKIIEVTIFKDQANVKREFNHMFEPGLYKIHFSHLAASLLDQSGRVSGKGTADTIILNVKVKKEYLTKALQSSTRTLQNQMEELTRRKRSLENQLDIFSQREKFLFQLSEKTAEAIAKGKTGKPIFIENQKDSLDFLEEQLTTLYTKRENVKNSIVHLRSQHKVLEKKYKLVTLDDGKEEKKVLVEKGFLEWELNVKPAEEKVIKVHYMITYPKDYLIGESF